MHYVASFIGCIVCQTCKFTACSGQLGDFRGLSDNRLARELLALRPPLRCSSPLSREISTHNLTRGLSHSKIISLSLPQN